MKKIKKATPYIAVFFVSFLIFLLWGKFDPEAYLVDDNRTQWFPIIERAYSDFFKTGKIPVYDFFQFKGFSVADQGYYGIMNPIMMIAYVLSHFTPLPFSTITIYLALLFSLGNVSYSALCRYFKCTYPETLILTAGYSGISSFVAFSVWYYVYNNYMIIPLMALVFLKSREKKCEYCGCGIILAFEILLGNVQYTCYHYMIYVIVCTVYAVFDNKRYIKVMLANILFAVMFSAPFMLMLLRASGGFQENEFLKMKLTFKDIFLGSFIPVGLINRFFSIYEKLFQSCMERTDYLWLFNGTFLLYWVILFFYVIIFIWKNKSTLFKKLLKCYVKNIYNTKIKRKDQSHIFIFALIAVLIFFTSFVTGGFAAIILSHVPVIKSFRFLFKCLFIIEPVLAILTVSVMPLFRNKLHKSVSIVLAVVSVIGLLNNFGTYRIVSLMYTAENNVTISDELSYSDDQIRKYFPDKDSYRFCTIMLTNRYTPDSFRYQYAYLRNFATSAEVYAAAGYETSISQSKLLDISKDEHFSRFFNSVFYSDFIDCIETNSADLKEIIRSNAIKYFLIEKDFGDTQFELYKSNKWKQPYSILEPELSDYLEKLSTPSMIVEKLEENGIEVEETKELNRYYDLIVLKETSGLCTGENDDVIPISSETMDTISFASNGSKSFMLSFDYDKHLTAFIKAQDGNKIPLKILPDNNNHIILQNPLGLTGNITVSYEDPLYICGFAGEIIFVFLIIGLLLFLFRESKTE